MRLAGELRIPFVGELDTSGAELREHVAALHAWGRIAREVALVSGTVPTVLAVTGACVSGPALALGLFDVVVMTEDAFAFVTGPDAVTDFTGVHVTARSLGSAPSCTPGAVVSRRSSSPMTRAAHDALLDDPLRTSPTTISWIRPGYESDDPRDRACAASPRPRCPSGRPRPTTFAS